ncbi:MAG TPA: RDD family protein [Baekduia sp.]|nr:RDD family protein [Baekduia sp.]
MAAPATTADVLTAEADATNKYAGVVSRAIALGIDAAIVQGTLLIVAALLALIAALVGGLDLGPAAQALAGAAWVVATAAYFVIWWSISGQTPGQRAMRLAVLTTDGNRPPNIIRSIVRVLWLGICILPLFAGFLPALVDDRRRGLHDLVAGTVVVHAPGR